MHKIFTLFFCAFITTFHPSIKASAPSADDEAYAAAARPKKKSIINSLSARAIGQEPPSILSRRGHILKIKNSITWPDDIDEENRDYCVKKMIDLELNVWRQSDTTLQIIPGIVLAALRNELSLESFSVNKYVWGMTDHAQLLAFVIMLDKNPIIDINKKFYDHIGNSRLIIHNAARYGTAALIRMLCKRGANIHSVEGKLLHTPLHAAVYTHNIDTMQELIKQGASLTAGDYGNRTALHTATIWPGRLQATILLLEHGANPYARTSDGRIALDNSLENRAMCFRMNESPSPSITAGIAYLEDFMDAHPPELYE